MSNVAINTLQFIDKYDGTEYCGYSLKFNKTGIWTPYYAIFNVGLELRGWPDFYMPPDEVLEGLKIIILSYVPNIKLRFSYGCNEFELQTDDASRYFRKHQDIIEAISEKYKHAVVFLEKDRNEG